MHSPGIRDSLDRRGDRGGQRLRGIARGGRGRSRARSSCTSIAAATAARISPARRAPGAVHRDDRRRPHVRPLGATLRWSSGCEGGSGRGARHAVRGAMILPGAMPWTNRYIGNPILTGMLNVIFGAHVSDAHCGMRTLRGKRSAPRTRGARDGVRLRNGDQSDAKQGLRIEEVPITYRPRVGDSKLSRVPDAWRHVRFMLVHSATFLFVVPGGSSCSSSGSPG